MSAWLTGSKVCLRCRKEKPVILFPRNLRTIEGLGSVCKVCMTAQKKELANKKEMYQWWCKVRKLLD